MLTIHSGIILYGTDLIPQKANICIDDNGKIAEISPNVMEGKLIDATGCFISPSFVNAHVHIGDSFIMDCGDGKSIDEIVKPPNGIKHRALANADDNDIINAMVRSMKIMVDSGTTKFIDYRENGIRGIKLLKESIDIFNSEYMDFQMDNRGMISSTIDALILGREDIFLEESPSLSKVKSKTKTLLKYCDGIATSGFGEIRDDVAKIIVEECNIAGKISSIHAGENIEAQKNSINNFGKSEINRAISIGFNQLVHITHPISKSKSNIISDLDLIAGEIRDDVDSDNHYTGYNAHNTYNSHNSINFINSHNPPNHHNSHNSNSSSIVLCPGANAILNLGAPPILDILKKGIIPLIGTDNIMLNSPNIINELNYTLKMSRAFYKDYIAPVEILKMATTNICKISSNTNNNSNNDINITTNTLTNSNNSSNINNNSNNSNNKLVNSISNEDNVKFNSKIQNFMNNSIEIGKIANLMIVKKVSKNPFLSIIHRMESKHIICLINNIINI
ncbi:MAG: amidohydrolase family protein [Methanobacteriaceae archaeon]